MRETGCWVLSSSVASCYEYSPSGSIAEATHNLIESIYKEYEEKAKNAKFSFIADRGNVLIFNPLTSNKSMANTNQHRKTVKNNKLLIIPFVINDINDLGDIPYTFTVFLKSITLKDKIFEKNIDIRSSVFFENVSFHSSTFNGNIITKFHHCTFCGIAEFDKAIFKQKVYFNECDFHGNALFKKTTFFADTEFIYNFFKNEVYFTYAIFYGKLDLEKSSTTGGLWLQDIYLKSFIYTNGSSFDKLILEKITFFDKDPNYPIKFDEYFENLKKIDGFDKRLESLRFTFNLLKSTYTQNYNHIEANTFYALEMLARDKELENGISLDDSFNKLVFTINKWTSNYGQSIKKPFFIILGLAFYWGWIFTDIDAFFSIFIPITDLVKMDIYKEVDKYIWWVKILVKILYTFSKVFALMLWWQLIRAIRKDIKR